MKIRRLHTLLLFNFLLLPTASLAQDSAWLEITLTSSEGILANQRYSGGIFFSAHEEALNHLQLYYRGGVSTLVAFDGNPDNDYFGIEGTIGLKFGGPVSFLGGVGVLLGQTNRCEFSINLSSEQCVDRSVAGLIPEIGVRLTLGEDFFITAFARKYILSAGEDDFFGRGISLGFGF